MCKSGLRMDQNVNVVDHQNPRPQVVQPKLPLAKLEGIGNTLRYPFILEPPRTSGSSVQLPIYGYKCFPGAK